MEPRKSLVSWLRILAAFSVAMLLLTLTFGALTHTNPLPWESPFQALSLLSATAGFFSWLTGLIVAMVALERGERFGILITLWLLAGLLMFGVLFVMMLAAIGA